MNLKYNECTKQWIVVTPLGAHIPFQELSDAEEFLDLLQNNDGYLQDNVDPPERTDAVEGSTSSRWVCFYSRQF